MKKLNKQIKNNLGNTSYVKSLNSRIMLNTTPIKNENNVVGLIKDIAYMKKNQKRDFSLPNQELGVNFELKEKPPLGEKTTNGLGYKESTNQVVKNPVNFKNNVLKK